MGEHETKQDATQRRAPMGWFDWLQTAATHPITVVAVGSAIGGNLRYWLGRWVEVRQGPGGLPWGTFIINVSGSLLLGLFAVWVGGKLDPASKTFYLLLGTGFCGGYTTFSTFELETYKLIRDGNWPAALAYVFGSVLIGFLGVIIGVGLGHLLFGRRP